MKFRSLILFLLCSSLPVFATHIIGGNFEVSQVGSNQFNIKLTIFKDCNPGTASLADMTISVFDAKTYTPILTTLLTVPEGDTLDLGDNCYAPPSLCVEEYTYMGNITLQNNPNGYILSTETCCRNFIIDNIVDPGNTGMTWSIQIPDPAIQNNSPQLGPYPKEGFLCLNVMRYLDLQAIDTDGDSLHYRLVTPYTSPSSGSNSPPFAPVAWKPGYSANKAIPGNPPLEINPLTGRLKCNASQLGVYVFAYSISEYRNGVKIGEVRRDMQLQVLPNCQMNFKPEFILPDETSFKISATNEICLPVLVVDSNATDSIYLTSFYTTDAEELEEEPTQLSKIGKGRVESRICYTANCVDVGRVSKVKIHLRAYSFMCEMADTARKTLEISLDPIPENTDDLFPNVFTPNNDGINDYFTIAEPDAIPCIEGMTIRIFNRWGALVYENTGHNFSWDGSYNEREASEGVYFFTIEGHYSERSFTYKNFLTLAR